MFKLCRSAHGMPKFEVFMCQQIDPTLPMLLGPRHLINDDGFRNALYMFDIGQNDIADSFSKNLSYVQVVKRIPSVLAEIKHAIQVRSVI